MEEESVAQIITSSWDDENASYLDIIPNSRP